MRMPCSDANAGLMTGGPLRWQASAGEFVVAHQGDASHEPLADVLILPSQPSLADARSALAATLSRLPGLTLAATRYDDGHHLLAASRGETISVRGSSTAAWAIAGYLEIVTCGRLIGGRSIGRGLVEHGEACADTFLQRAVDALGQRQRFGEVAAGCVKVAVIVADLSIGDQHVRMEYRRA
jgi:hypothetical protein